jgi:hypothetical protein
MTAGDLTKGRFVRDAFKIVVWLLTGAVVSACTTTPHAPSGVKSGAAAEYAFRAPQPAPGIGEARTIFSPLAWPEPNSIRSASGVPGPDYWQQKADYTLDATLDEDARTITAKGTITYTNNSPDALDFLWLHLEQNLNKKESLGTLSTEPNTRFGFRGFEGGIQNLVISTPGKDGKELDVHVYDTLARVELPSPIKPKGGQVTLDMAWSFKIPPFGADRMGVQEVKDGLIFEIAQWFPAAAVYDDVHGWNTLPYLGQGEFYTNFGSFDVRLTVPRSHIVVCTGVLQNPLEALPDLLIDRLVEARKSEKPVVIIGEDDVENPATRPDGEGAVSWHFKADNVRTVAWASSKAFLWDGCNLAAAGPSDEKGKPKGTFVQSVYPKEAAKLWGEQATDDLRFSIAHYSEKWYRYPYPIATNVNGIVGGMEYPMIIFCSERHDEHGLYGVTTHEIGHNWFPMLVNTDERRHAWMDEGFNSFINIYSNRERFPEKGGGRSGMRGPMQQYVDQMKLGQQQAMETPADQIWRGRLGNLEYAKTQLAMKLLREEVLGPERFDAAFRRYIAAWAFKSPQPSDFFRCMENAAGVDLSWFWRGWFYGIGTLDQAIVHVEYDDGGHHALVAFANKGELVMPLVYRVRYTDGSEETRKVPAEAWATTNEWIATWDTRDAEGTTRVISEIVVDPEEALPDVDRENNVWRK